MLKAQMENITHVDTILAEKMKMNKQLNTEIDRVISQLSRIDQKAAMLIGINSIIITASLSFLGFF